MAFMGGGAHSLAHLNAPPPTPAAEAAAAPLNAGRFAGSSHEPPIPRPPRRPRRPPLHLGHPFAIFSRFVSQASYHLLQLFLEPSIVAKGRNIYARQIDFDHRPRHLS